MRVRKVVAIDIMLQNDQVEVVVVVVVSVGVVVVIESKGN
jgi:hypothetical protein